MRIAHAEIMLRPIMSSRAFLSSIALPRGSRLHRRCRQNQNVTSSVPCLITYLGAVYGRCYAQIASASLGEVPSQLRGTADSSRAASQSSSFIPKASFAHVEASELESQLQLRLSQGTEAAFSQARDLWEEIIINRGTNPSPALYELMLRIYLQDKDLLAARGLIYDMQGRQVLFSPSLYNLALQAYALSTAQSTSVVPLGKTMQLLDWMVENKIPITAESYEAVITACCRLGDETKARECVDALKKGNKPITVAALVPFVEMRARKPGDVPAVLAEIENIKALGLVPNSDAYEPAFSLLLFKERDLAKALALWKDLQQHGTIPTPKLVATFIGSGNMELIRGALMDLKRSRIDIPWHQIFRILLERNHFMGLRLLISKFLPRHTALMNNLLHRCIVHKTHKTGLDLFEVMLSSGFAPDTITVPIVINLAGICKDLPRAFTLFEELCGPQSKWKVPKSVSAYTALFVACSKNNDVIRAFDTMHALLQDRSIHVDSRALNKFVVHVVRRHEILGRKETTPWDFSSHSVKALHPREIAEFATAMGGWLARWKAHQAAPQPSKEPNSDQSQ